MIGTRAMWGLLGAMRKMFGQCGLEDFRDDGLHFRVGHIQVQRGYCDVVVGDSPEISTFRRFGLFAAEIEPVIGPSPCIEAFIHEGCSLVSASLLNHELPLHILRTTVGEIQVVEGVVRPTFWKFFALFEQFANDVGRQVLTA